MWLTACRLIFSLQPLGSHACICDPRAPPQVMLLSYATWQGPKPQVIKVILSVRTIQAQRVGLPSGRGEILNFTAGGKFCLQIGTTLQGHPASKVPCGIGRLFVKTTLQPCSFLCSSATGVDPKDTPQWMPCRLICIPVSVPREPAVVPTIHLGPETLWGIRKHLGVSLACKNVDCQAGNGR
jgi:hypothetical protein